MTATIKLNFDPASSAWLNELSRLLRLFSESLDQPVDLLKLIRSFGRGGIGGDLNLRATGGTDDCRIILELSERLGNLMSALRAWDGKGEFVADLGHGGVPSGSDPSSVAEAETGVLGFPSNVSREEVGS